MGHQRFKLALAIVLCYSCAPRGSEVAVGAAGAAGVHPALDGHYAICDGAYAHIESLTLRGETFEHIIQSHGRYGARSKGTYRLAGDRLVMTVEESLPLPGVQQVLRLDYDFVVGEYAGHRVLWRGAYSSIGSAVQRPAMTDYAALFYGGPDPVSRKVPSCAEIRGTRGSEVRVP